MKKKLLLALILVAASIAVTALTGNFSPINVVALSFTTFTLIFGFAFWLFIDKSIRAEKNWKRKIKIYKEGI